MRVLISPARPVESSKPPMWITYVKAPSRDGRSKKTADGTRVERPDRGLVEDPHMGLQPKDYPVGSLTIREGTQALTNRGPLHMREYRHGVLTPRSTSTLPGPGAQETPAGGATSQAVSKMGTLEMDETLKDILGSQTSRLSKRQSFQLHPVANGMVYPWHSIKTGKKKSARITTIVKEHSNSKVTTLEDDGTDSHVPPLDLSKLEDHTEIRMAKPRAPIPPIQAQVNEPELSRTIGVRAHLDLYRDSKPPPSPYTYHQQEKKKRNVMIVVPKMPSPHITGNLDSVRSEGVTRALDSYNEYSLTKQDEKSSKRPGSAKKKVMFASPGPEHVNTSRLSDGVSQALSSYEGDNFARPEPAAGSSTRKKLIIVTKPRGPQQEPYFETCRSDGVKGALDFYNDYGLTRRDVPPYVSPRGHDTRKITEMHPPHMGELTRSRVKSGGVRNTISSFINMDDGVSIADILATKKRVRTLPTVTPRNPNAIFEPEKDSHEVGVVGALTSYNDSSLTPRDIHPILPGDSSAMNTPRFGPNSQLLNALEIADRTKDAMDTARERQEYREAVEKQQNEERYRRDFPDPSRALPPVHNPEEQRIEAGKEDWKWKGPTSGKFHWKTDARRRAKESYPDEEHDVNKRMHNREFKGPMYLL